MQISNVYLRKNSGIWEKISHVQSIADIAKQKKVRKIAIPEFANFKNTHIWKLVNRLHHTCTSILIQFRGAFLCPKASETAWISKSNRSLERVQKQKNRLRFSSEPAFCLRKRFFVGKNAPKIF